MPKRVVFILLFVSACFIKVNDSANVLCMFTSPGKSQLVVFMAVANSLIERGHNVTVITTIPILRRSNPKSNMPFRHILLEPPEEAGSKLNDKLAKIADRKRTETSDFKMMAALFQILKMFTYIQKDTLAREQFQRFLQEDNHFDLMLLGYFHNDFLVGVAARYRCPIAVISLGAPYGPISKMVGNPLETSYVQFPLFGRNQPMSFTDRLLNFLWAAVESCIEVCANRMMEHFYNNLFTSEFYPKYSDVIRNISLVLCNNHFSQLPIQPLVPAVIEIGGVQAKERPDPLPEDIQAFLDSSVNGVILYTVGSKARGTSLKPDKLKIIIDVLSKLDLNILFELETTEEPPKNYSNIFFRQVLPYEDILFHPNIKLYIMDGRANAIFAAGYCGVPMVGIPLYADEPYNVEDMINNGFGVSVDANTFTENSLKKALAEVLENPKYNKKSKHFSTIYRDRPIAARETAAFWLEYVIRHRGALHMQSPLVHMSFVERWNLDVITVLLISLYIFKKLIKLVVCLVRIGLELRAKRIYKACKSKEN